MVERLEKGRFFTHISLKNIDMGKKSPFFLFLWEKDILIPY